MKVTVYIDCNENIQKLSRKVICELIRFMQVGIAGYMMIYAFFLGHFTAERQRNDNNRMITTGSLESHGLTAGGIMNK